MITNLSQSRLMQINAPKEVKRWYVADDTTQIQKLLSNTGTNVDLKNTSLEEIFKSIVSSITVSDKQIHLKLNKDLIIESPNQIFIADNLNIQIAKQIHLNPNIEHQKIK